MIKLNNILLEVAKGDCYQAAGRLMTKLRDGHTLVHGMVNGQGALEGKRFGHAWVETNDTVLDHSNGRELEIPKDLYYAIGGVRKEDNKYYDTDESLKWILKAKHWGPWEMSGDTISMYEDVPTDDKEVGKEEVPVDRADITKLMPMLKEIGDGSAKAFPWQYHEEHPAADSQDFGYTFKTDKGDYYVSFVHAGTNEWDLAFGPLGSSSSFNIPQSANYGVVTGIGAFRVMATIVEIVKDFLDSTFDMYINDKDLYGEMEHALEPKKISFNTTKEDGRSEKEDSRRSNLYKAYIQKQVPGARVERQPSGAQGDAYVIHLP